MAKAELDITNSVNSKINFLIIISLIILVNEHAIEAHVCAEATELIRTPCGIQFLNAFTDARTAAVALGAGYRPVHGLPAEVITGTHEQL